MTEAKKWLIALIACVVLLVCCVLAIIGLLFASVWLHGDASSRCGGSAAVLFLCAVLLGAVCIGLDAQREDAKKRAVKR